MGEAAVDHSPLGVIDPDLLCDGAGHVDSAVVDLDALDQEALVWD